MNTPTGAHKTAANGNNCPLCTPRFSLSGIFKLIIFYLEDAWRPLLAIFLVSFVTIIPFAILLWLTLGPVPFDLVMPLSYVSPGLSMPEGWMGWGNLFLWTLFGFIASAFVMRQIFWWAEHKTMPPFERVFQVSLQDARWLLYFALLFCLCSVRHVVKETCPNAVCARPTQVIALPDRSPGARIPPAYLSTQGASKSGDIYHQEVNIGQCKLQMSGAGYMFRDLIPHIVWSRFFHYVLESILTIIGLSLAVRYSLAIHAMLKKLKNPLKRSFVYTRRAGVPLFLGALFITFGYLLMREIIMVGLLYIIPVPHPILWALYSINAVLWTMIYGLYLTFSGKHLMSVP
jgi:hypothetical protein